MKSVDVAVVGDFSAGIACYRSRARHLKKHHAAFIDSLKLDYSLVERHGSLISICTDNYYSVPAASAWRDRLPGRQAKLNTLGGVYAFLSRVCQ